jgi:amino acid adenylation domain-containing protein
MSSQLNSIAPLALPGRDLKAKLNAQHQASSHSHSHIYPREGPCVQHLVTAQALAAPDALALTDGRELVTYRELNDRSNQVANYLLALGVRASEQTDNLVALCLDRSVAAVTCALGVLKAGGAYLPLDSGYPVERLAFMLSDARPRVLITQAEVAHRLSHVSPQTIVIDRDWHDKISCQSTNDPLVEITTDHLAYVIYTSGSSGRPKGVEITHASLMNLVWWHQSAFAVTRTDRTSLLAGVGFDAAVWETWPYLSAGASLHLADECTRVSPERLRDWLLAEAISITFLPTALAERVMTLPWPRETPLRLLLTGAETLHRFPASDLPFRLVNNYGPTECTVVATSGFVSPDPGRKTLPTIGRPIANTEIYILDEKLQEVPAGTTGELHIGGAGVARGYRNQPELTSEKFIPNPFNGSGSGRLYKTGDLARYLEDGEVAYVGRRDDQIKILGHRIEPNEIVVVLNRHPSIQASVVVARADADGEKRLVAYVVPSRISQPASAALQTFLGNELPEHMVPARFVQLEKLPLTKNGKVDQAALPAPNAENILREEEFVAPRTPIEDQLAAMISALLGLTQVSVSDNFFMLGGHSLLGTQLISQIRGAFGVELALRTLFDAPTIEQLGIEVERLLTDRVAAMSEDEVLRLLV